MTPQERLAYCAGLFDGEGCISIRRFVDNRPRTTSQGLKRARHGLRHQLAIEVSQVRPEATQFLHETFGGSLSFNARNGSSGKSNKDYAGRWFWLISSQRAADALSAMRPFLLIKLPEVDVALRFQATKDKWREGRSQKLGLTAAEVAERELLYHEIARLKRIHNDPAVQASYVAASRDHR